MTTTTLHLLRIYTAVSATRDGQPYWKILIDRARSMGLANAAVFQVLDGFGPAAIVHQGKAHDLAPESHVILEIIDTESQVRNFRDTLEVTDDTGLVILETVGVIGYGGHHHPTGRA